MNSLQILEAMGHIDDTYITSAQKRLGRERAQKTLPFRSRSFSRRVAGIAAAVLLIAAAFTTAMAVNEDFRELVYDFFRVEQAEVVPHHGSASQHDPESSDPARESMTVEPEKILIGGVIESTYVHTPAASYARSGGVFICTDGQMMNSGNHYDAYIEENGEFIKLQERTFSQDYTILGNDFHVEFQWVEVNGYCCYTYIDADVSYRKPNMAGPVEATLFWFPCRITLADGTVSSTNYPVLINLETGELTDILAGTGADQLPNIHQAAISEDLCKILLVTGERELYYADLTAKKLYSVDALSGEHTEECSLTGNILTCWTLEGASIETAALGAYKIWTIDLNTMERRDLFSGIPATPATSHNVWSETYCIAENAPVIWEEIGGFELPPLNVAGLHFIEGFSKTSHWGNMYSGSKFAIEVDDGRNVYVIDLANGERSLIEGFLWPDVAYPTLECQPSADGNKLLIYYRTAYDYYDSIGVLDFSAKSYFQFSRENLNDVHEQSIYWFDDQSIIIFTDDTETTCDYYIYRLLD